MKACPDCGSNKVYRYKKTIDAGGGYGPDLLPKLSPRRLGFAKFLPVVCKDCGLVRYYATEETREALGSNKHWELND